MPAATKKRRFDFRKLDASENAFFERSLEVVKSKTYDYKYPALRGREFVPVDNSIDNAAQTITYAAYSQVGMAKLLASYADDLPRSDVLREEKSVNVKGMGDSYGYSVQDIRAARRAGVDLDGKKAEAARRAIEILIDRIIALGDSATGLLGLLNQPNALVYVVPNGAGGVATWVAGAGKTPKEILKDLIGIAEYVSTQTKEIEKINTIIVPRAQFVHITTTLFDDAVSDRTILEHFNATYQASQAGNQNRNAIAVESWDLLKTAGSGGTARMVAYDRRPEALEVAIPQEFEQFPPQEENLEFVVPCHARIGGVLVYYPLSMAYGDGI